MSYIELMPPSALAVLPTVRQNMIAIDPNTWLAYEGSSNYGHGVWPTPILTKATFVHTEEDWSKVPCDAELRNAKYVFREDYFDPVTRIRRGRFYEWADGRPQPDSWWIHRHPVVLDEVGQRNAQGMVWKSMLSFFPIQSMAQHFTQGPHMLVVLGAMQAVTVWNVVSVEKVGAGEDLVTMRARSSLGFLPELLLSEIPDSSKAGVMSAVAKVVDAVHRSSGISVVDLCRDAAQVILSAHLTQETGASQLSGLELGKVIAKIPEKSYLLRNAAEVIRLLHTRGKSNAQHNLGTRPVSESDGMFALEALSFLLRDIGWAR